MKQLSWLVGAVLRPLLVVFFMTSALPSFAQDQAPAAAPTVSTAELERLVGMLENDAERQKFVERLRAVIEAQRRTAPAEPVIPDRVAGRFLATLSEEVAEFSHALFGAAAFVTDAPKFFAWLQHLAENEWARTRLTEIFGKLAIVLFGAWIAEWVTTRLLGSTRRRIERQEIRSGWARVPFLLFHLVIGLIPVVVFAVAAFGLLTVVDPTRTARLVALAFINANLIARAVRLVARAVLAPSAPGLRLVPADDETAIYLQIWVRRLTNVTVYGYFAAEAALMIGLPRSGHVFVMKLLGVVVGLLLAIFILQNRGQVARLIAGHIEGSQTAASLRRRLAEIWHVGALIYVGFVTFIWLVRPDGGFTFVARATGLTVLILLLAWAISALLRRAVARLFQLSTDMHDLFPTLEQRANRYVQILIVVGTTIIYVAAALMILQAWGAGSLDWLSTPGGRRIGSSLISVGLTALVALGLWELVNAMLERWLNRPPANGVNGLRRQARARTLLPLLRQITFGFLAVFVGLVALSEIGINIAPLLAGAGIVGIAVGFGAQALMKDLFSGISIVLEDSMAVGDIVTIGDKGGVVEWMSLRVMRLRDFDGTVHTIPFGEVQTISNRTKDFAYAVFRIRVAYGSDVEKVQRVMREVAGRLRANPEFGPMILDDLELHGVDNFTDSAIIVLGRIKVMPARQWTIMRNYNLLLKEAFDREGIEMPFPQRVVRVVRPDGDGKFPDAETAGAAG
ncbi:MAG TPA: mechanosensitive ion channel domain-containing protein [Alphaproteobacteria bacterium]